MNEIFSGTPGCLGGISNEKELAEKCPQEFFSENNPWPKFAMEFAFNGYSVDTNKWSWKVPENIREKVKLCVRAVALSFLLTREKRRAIAGWMLSEALSDIPQS